MLSAPDSSLWAFLLERSSDGRFRNTNYCSINFTGSSLQADLVALLELFENDQGSYRIQCVGGGRSRYLFHSSIVCSRHLMCVTISIMKM